MEDDIKPASEKDESSIAERRKLNVNIKQTHFNSSDDKRLHVSLPKTKESQTPNGVYETGLAQCVSIF